MPEPGDQIASRYTVAEKLGAGGMGAVYRARDERLRRDVALKLLAPSQTGDATTIARMIREAQATAALEHDHIIAVYDVGPSGDGGAYIAMQLVVGETLRDRMAAGLETEEALRIVTDVGNALAFAHRAGIVHRDVKPDNVMLRAEDDRVVVMDFGLARFVEPEPDDHTLTAQGSFVGTPAYLAPEQARGGDIDGRADQFALAVMTWELLSGRLPWSGETLTAMLASVLTDDPAPLKETCGTASHVSDAVARALSKAPDQRFSDMSAFVAAIRGDAHPEMALLDTMQASSAEVPVAGVSAEPNNRGPGLAVAAIGAAVLLAAGVWWSMQREPIREESDAHPLGLLELAPPTCTQAAVEVYMSGIRALRDGNADRARAAFARAAELDPTCAAAHLRHVTSRSWRDDPAAVQSSFRRANEGRRTLSERDGTLLAAYAELHWHRVRKERVRWAIPCASLRNGRMRTPSCCDWLLTRPTTALSNPGSR